MLSYSILKIQALDLSNLKPSMPMEASVNPATGGLDAKGPVVRLLEAGKAAGAGPLLVRAAHQRILAHVDVARGAAKGAHGADVVGIRERCGGVVEEGKVGVQGRASVHGRGGGGSSGGSRSGSGRRRRGGGGGRRRGGGGRTEWPRRGSNKALELAPAGPCAAGAAGQGGLADDHIVAVAHQGAGGADAIARAGGVGARIVKIGDGGI